MLFLLAAVLTAPLTAQGMLLDSSSHQPSAGCHEDSGNTPKPVPASHSCCEGGHDFAMLPQSASATSPLQLLVTVHSRLYSVVASDFAVLNLVMVAGDPPILSPLRV